MTEDKDLIAYCPKCNARLGIEYKCTECYWRGKISERKSEYKKKVEEMDAKAKLEKLKNDVEIAEITFDQLAPLKKEYMEKVEEITTLVSTLKETLNDARRKAAEMKQIMDENITDDDLWEEIIYETFTPAENLVMEHLLRKWFVRLIMRWM